MTESFTVMKVFVGIGAVLAVGIPIFGMGQYVSELRFQMETSKAEVSLLKGQVAQLQDILQKTQAGAASGVGPKGDPGEKGEPGQRGERGPAGVGADTATIDAMIKEAVSAQLALIQDSASGSARATSMVDTSGGFDLSSCLPADEVMKARTISVRVGTEICDADGSLLVSVKEIRGDRIVFFQPGQPNWSMKTGDRRNFDWDKKRQYFFARIAKDSEGEDIATIQTAAK